MINFKNLIIIIIFSYYFVFEGGIKNKIIELNDGSRISTPHGGRQEGSNGG